MARWHWRKVVHALLLTGLLLSAAAGAPPSGCLPVAAQDGIDVVTSRASHQFADQITFSLDATSPAEITQVHLYYWEDVREQQTQTVGLPTEPSTEIHVEFSHDLRQFPFMPFATVAFQWRIEDASGSVRTTDPQRYQCTDNRVEWEIYGGGAVNVHCVAGHCDPVFGQAAVDVAQASMADISADLQVDQPNSVDIYVYDSQNTLDGAMSYAGREWVRGQAHPELGVILVAISPELGYESRMKRDIPHEITHLVVYQAVTPAGYDNVPEWLDEGLATSSEQANPDHQVILTDAAERGGLFPLESLCTPFSPEARDASLSYAQSASIVSFIRQQYGADGIRRLLDAYENGASCSSGVKDALGITLPELEALWLQSLPGEPEAPAVPASLGRVMMFIGAWLLSLIVVLPMLGGLRRRR